MLSGWMGALRKVLQFSPCVPARKLWGREGGGEGGGRGEGEEGVGRGNMLVKGEMFKRRRER